MVVSEERFSALEARTRQLEARVAQLDAPALFVAELRNCFKTFR